MRVPALAAGQVPAGEQACFGALQATPSVITQSHQNSQMHVDSAGKVWSHGVLGVWGLVLQTREPFPKGTDQCLFTGAPGFAEGAWAWHAWGCPSPCERWIPRVEPQSANRDLACSACRQRTGLPGCPGNPVEGLEAVPGSVQGAWTARCMRQPLLNRSCKLIDSFHGQFV